MRTESGKPQFTDTTNADLRDHTIVKINNSVSTKSIYKMCSDSEKGSPQHNLHDGLHRILLKKYKDLLDPIHFKRFIKNEFHPRRWELYSPALISEFNDNVKIEKFKHGGPDFKITMQSGCVFYMECTAPGEANTQQNIRQVLKSIKRSLQKKKDKYNEWVHNEIIKKDDIFVLSIGLYGFDSIIILHWNELIDHVYSLFASPNMQSISAVILSKDCDQTAMTDGKPFLFNDLRLIHNPSTNTPLPTGTLNVFQEYKNEKLINENKNMYVFFEEKSNKIISHNIKNSHVIDFACSTQAD